MDIRQNALCALLEVGAPMHLATSAADFCLLLDKHMDKDPMCGRRDDDPDYLKQARRLLDALQKPTLTSQETSMGDVVFKLEGRTANLESNGDPK